MPDPATFDDLTKAQRTALATLGHALDTGQACRASNHTNGDPRDGDLTVGHRVRARLEWLGLCRWANMAAQVVELTEDGEKIYAEHLRPLAAADTGVDDELEVFGGGDTDDQAEPDEDRQVLTPATPLPDFEGNTPTAVITRLVGTSQRITHAIHHRQRGVAVIEWECTGIAFPLTEDGVKRVQTIKVLDLLEVGDPHGRRMLNELKLAQDPSPLPFKSKADDEIFGTDALGLEAGDVEPVAVVFSDGSRAAWPDDFAEGTPRPDPGSFAGDADTGLAVVEIRSLIDGTVIAPEPEQADAEAEA